MSLEKNEPKAFISQHVTRNKGNSIFEKKKPWFCPQFKWSQAYYLFVLHISYKKSVVQYSQITTDMLCCCVTTALIVSFSLNMD